jgi:hypothetical protein
VVGHHTGSHARSSPSQNPREQSKWSGNEARAEETKDSEDDVEEQHIGAGLEVLVKWYYRMSSDLVGGAVEAVFVKLSWLSIVERLRADLRWTRKENSRDFDVI